MPRKRRRAFQGKEPALRWTDGFDISGIGPNSPQFSPQRRAQLKRAWSEFREQIIQESMNPELGILVDKFFNEKETES